VDLRKLRAETGFTIIEVLVAATMVIVGVAAALSLIDRANATTVTTKSREAATSLARELVESVRAVQYDRLTPTTLLAELAAQPGLTDSVAGGAYTLVRRNVIYTVTGSVCTLDDSSDGGGIQTGGNFCAGSAGLTTPPDRTPEDYKRATLRVAWTRAGVTRAVVQTALVNNPGSAGAPFVRSIATNPIGQTMIVNPALGTLRLDFVTSSAAASLNWMIDGSVRASAPAPDAARLNWRVDWNLEGIPDGPYVVGAEAYDAYGLAGPTRQLTITLNRFPPAPPSGVSGGRNRYGDVEIEWAANSERDIVGYEVRRGGEVVCALQTLGTGTECLDSNPPDEAGGSQTYTVYAFDRSDGANRPGSGTPVEVIAGNLAPVTPVAVRRGSGDVTLAWTRPSPEDAGPAGDRIAYYRIYRDGRGYANRYAAWYAPEADVSWTDPDPGGTSHTYWVTSVDTHRLESESAGGVTTG